MPTQVRDFVGEDEILQGTDWRRTVPFDSSMVDFDPAITPGAALRGAVVSADLATTYLQTSDGSMVLEWLDATTLQVGFSEAGTAASDAFRGAIWQVEAKSGATLLWDRIAQGRANMSPEACRSAT